MVVVATVSTVVSGTVPVALSNTNEYPATPDPLTSVESVQMKVIGESDENAPAVCVVELATTEVGGTISATTLTVRVDVATFPAVSLDV